MLAPGTLLMTAVVGGECPPGGVSSAHDLTNEGNYAGHLQGDTNGDGEVDLRVHFPVPGSGIGSGTTEICIKGQFTVPVTGDPAFEWEARAAVNVNQ
jgi:hypothetical protein